MNEFLSSTEDILSFVFSLLGGSTGVGAFIAAIVYGIKNKKYSGLVASSNAKDAQIQSLKNDIKELKDVVGLMMSAFTTQQLSSMALTPETKKHIVAIASRVEQLTSIKLDSVVGSALEIMTNVNPSAISEEKRQEIVAEAEKAQKVLDDINNRADSIVEQLAIE